MGKLRHRTGICLLLVYRQKQDLNLGISLAAEPLVLSMPLCCCTALRQLMCGGVWGAPSGHVSLWSNCPLQAVPCLLCSQRCSPGACLWLQASPSPSLHLMLARDMDLPQGSSFQLILLWLHHCGGQYGWPNGPTYRWEWLGAEKQCIWAQSH